MIFPASSSNSTTLAAGEEDIQENWADIWALEDPAISGAAPADDSDDRQEHTQ